MTCWKTMVCGGAWLAAALALSGCLPTGESSGEEEKDAHFLAGKSRVNEMDYKGAIEAFEQALETNPRSASAHFELAWLFDQKEADPAAAIYHYERYLKFRPGAENGETVRTRVVASKQELARTISLGPVTQSLQREFEELNKQNAKLREELARWRAFASARAQAQATLPGVTPVVLRATPLAPDNASRSSRAAADARGLPASATPVAKAANPATSATANAAARGRTHAVKSGETLTVIARKYGVKVSKLVAANPQVDERRLRVGQTLTVPSA